MRIKENLLPNYFKIIGLVVAILSAALLWFMYANPESLPFTHLEIQKWIVKDMLLVSLLFMIFSREKKESQKIKMLRLDKAKRALIFGALLLIFDSVREMIFFDGKFEMKSGFELIVLILVFYLLVFLLRKYNYRGEWSDLKSSN